MQRITYAAIVAAAHARTGKTLLSRVLADYFMVSGDSPMIFDTDPIEQTLSASFPTQSLVVDINQVRDQMLLFDNLASPSADTRVVDLSHLAFRKFFNLMRDTDFIPEARFAGVEPLIFYIVDHDRRSLEEGRLLLDRFADCAVVVVDNGHLRQPTSVTRRSSDYRALHACDLHLAMPALDAVAATVIEEDPLLSLGELLRQPLRSSIDADDLAGNARAAIRGWVLRLFREIHRVNEILATRLAADPVPPQLTPTRSDA
ncbi:MAG: hypothetical protein ABSG76_01075 [Xanthobacteraceae bacterium]